MSRRTHAVRHRVASLVWVAAALCALFLAVGALLTVLHAANQHNQVVGFVTDTAARLAGPLGDLFTFRGEDSARTKTVLVNWGIAALGYLLAGKVLDRVIRP